MQGTWKDKNFNSATIGRKYPKEGEAPRIIKFLPAKFEYVVAEGAKVVGATIALCSVIFYF